MAKVIHMFNTIKPRKSDLFSIPPESPYLLIVDIYLLIFNI